MLVAEQRHGERHPEETHSNKSRLLWGPFRDHTEEHRIIAEKRQEWGGETEVLKTLIWH